MYIPKKRMDFLHFVIPDENGNCCNGKLVENAPEDVKEEWERYQEMMDEAEEKFERL